MADIRLTREQYAKLRRMYKAPPPVERDWDTAPGSACLDDMAESLDPSEVHDPGWKRHADARGGVQ